MSNALKNVYVCSKFWHEELSSGEQEIWKDIFKDLAERRENNKRPKFIDDAPKWYIKPEQKLDIWKYS